MSKISALRKIIIAGVFASAIFVSVPAFAASTLYEQIDQQLLAKGINYQYKHRLTSEGWLDIYVLTADISDSDITVNPIESSKEIGLKETVNSLINESKAVAGVNSAYFGLTGSYSASFGPVIAQGDILSIDTDKNINSNQFGTFFIDDDQNPMLGYFKTTMNFVVEGEKLFDFASINKITEMKYPIIFDENGGKNTAQLDARFPNLVKITVENGRITYVSKKGETVNVPANGYLVILSSEYADQYADKLLFGYRAEVETECNFDLDNIETAITGGGIILDGGSKPASTGEISTGRQPRTLLGLSKDKKTLKLIVADGKRSGGDNASIGLTPDEAVQLLKEEGMYYGLNLDGGGSSTMAVKDDYGTAQIVNSPAEGTARKVMTAVGIFDSSEVGKAESVIIESSTASVAPGGTFELKLYGYDKNHHKIMISPKDVQLSIEGGTLIGNTITAGTSGTVVIKAEYGTSKAEHRVAISELVSINPSVSELYLDEGETVSFTVKGTTADGATVDITNKAEITADIGTVSGGTYTAPSSAGGGLIRISSGGLTNYIKVSVGGERKNIDSFENIQYLNYSAYPADIQGIAGITTKYVSDGGKALGLSYYFKQADTTQAAYLSFAGGGLSISGAPKTLIMDVYGNGTGQWVRGKIADTNGTEYVIDFSRDVNWNGEYATVTADIPKDVVYPIKLKTIYVAALSNTNTEQQVMYFDNLRGDFAAQYNIDVPAATVGGDKLKADTSVKETGYYYANISGTVLGTNVADKALYTNSRVKAREALEKDADVSVYGGATDVAPTGKTETIKWTNGYAFYSKNGIDFVNLTAVNGGLKATKPEQWQKFKNDVLATSNKCVVFVMDTTPSNFTDDLEAQLFRDVLQDLRADNRTIFVVSSSGTGFWESMRDGIRYVNLPSLWTANGTLNGNYRILRIKTNGNSVSYEIKSVF